MADECTDNPSPEEFTNTSPDPDADLDLAVLCDLLQEHGVKRFLVRYEGSGDSGSANEIETLPEGITLPPWVEKKLLDVAENYCPDGYQNNEGGYGRLTVYPFLGLAQLKHYDCYEGSEDIEIQPLPLPDELRRRLTQLGVIQVAGRFDGYGDSGQMEEMTVQPESVELGDLEDELEGFLLDQLPGGWENNEGAHGGFTVDVTTGQVHVDAYWRVEKSADPAITRWRWRQ